MSARPLRGAAEMVPIEHETSDRVVRTIVFAVPPAALGSGAGWRGAGSCIGMTCSCWRSPTRSPGSASPSASIGCSPTAASRPRARVRALLAVLGSMAVEGPVIEWVATHRKHHRYSDSPGDPHSPHVDQAPGLARRAARTRACARRLDVPRQGHGQPRPLREGPARRSRPALHQPHVPALGGGRARPPVRPRRRPDRHRSREGSPVSCGAARCASSSCITSPSASTRCATSSAGDRSPPAISRTTSPGSRRRLRRGVAQQPPRLPDLGRHGLGRRQLDPGAWLISGLERCHLAWDVIRISPARQQAKRRSAPGKA